MERTQSSSGLVARSSAALAVLSLAACAPDWPHPVDASDVVAGLRHDRELVRTTACVQMGQHGIFAAPCGHPNASVPVVLTSRLPLGQRTRFTQVAGASLLKPSAPLCLVARYRYIPNGAPVFLELWRFSQSPCPPENRGSKLRRSRPNNSSKPTPLRGAA
jgi:hypothetical protein